MKHVNIDDNIGNSNAGNLAVLSDIKTLRKRARHHIEEGAVTNGYAADRDTVIRLLNEALATELVCVLRYKRHYFMAKGIHSEPVKAEFLEHAAQEMVHADRLAERITQLGGAPDFSPDELSSRSHAEYIEADTLHAMIKENLVAERIAVESYREMIAYLADNDPTTQRMLKEILAMEEGSPASVRPAYRPPIAARQRSRPASRSADGSEPSAISSTARQNA